MPAQSAGGQAAANVKPRKMSAAAKNRIAAAQRKRWAEYHRAKGAPAKKAKKRHMSAAARERIAAATRKRWIAYRAAKAAALSAAGKPKKKAAVRRSAVKRAMTPGAAKVEQTTAS